MSAVLALLVCGHVLADFLFQTAGMLRAKRRSWRGLARHAVEVACVQAVVVLPFSWSLTGLGLIAGIAATHLGIDASKVALDRRFPRRRLAWLAADQGAHVAVLVAAAALWPVGAQLASPADVARFAVVVAVVVFNGNGGSAIVAATLAGLEPPAPEAADAGREDDDGPKGAGRLIGMLERWMILGLVWGGQWGAVGLVLTAKSVARFKRMDEQAFAEVYLVGTMTSVIVAMLSGTLLRALSG